jgi:hypothetical protein
MGMRSPTLRLRIYVNPEALLKSPWAIRAVDMQDLADEMGV